ncbi:MAG: amidohydrolase [Chloroflexi bacterium]|nr:amidohydrolase [Chloroflexota bacterium]
MIIDFHTHILPPWLREQRQRYLAQDSTFRALYSNPKTQIATAEDLLAGMKVSGVDVAVVMGIGWKDAGLAREVNDYVIEVCRRYPDKLVGFSSVNPAWGEAAALEAERCAQAGLRGVGELHPDIQGFDLGEKETMMALAQVARAYRSILLVHSSEPIGHTYEGKGMTTPEVLWRFIQIFPDLVVVCAHWGGGLPFYALMPEVGQALGNTYFDSAASPFLYRPKVFASVAKLVGSARILFGSDYPLVSQDRLIRQVRGCGLSLSDQDAILGKNAARLLELSPGTVA